MTVTAPTQSTPLDADTFRHAMSMLAAPLTVVTTVDAASRRWGFTASSVTSVSLNPPRVLVGLATTSSCHPALTTSPEFVVNVLGEQHQQVASAFAARGVDRFVGQDFDTWPGTGLPVLRNALAAYRCTRVERILAGDHELLLGQPVGLRLGAPSRPLVWYQRRFLSPETPVDTEDPPAPR